MTNRYKVLDVNACGKHLEAHRVLDTKKGVKYELRIVWYDYETIGFRRSKLKEYPYFEDVLTSIRDFYGFRWFELSVEEIKRRYKEA